MTRTRQLCVGLRRRVTDAVSDALHAVVEPALRRTSAPLSFAVAYHRIAEKQGERDRFLVRPLARSRLEADIRFLARRYRLVRASELRHAASTRRRGERFPLAVTFDDDCHSYATIAAPLLERHDQTATFFLTGASLDGPRPFWWESLDALAARRPLELARVVGALELTDVPGRSPRTLAELARTVRGLSPSRRRLVDERCGALADDLHGEPGLQREAIRDLSERGFEIGFHTREHHALPGLDEHDLAAALDDGRDRLERATGTRCTSIAYPYGECDEAVADAAGRAGFSAGFTLDQRPVLPETPPLRMGRIDPSHRSTSVLARRLALALVHGAWSARGRPAQTARASSSRV